MAAIFNAMLTGLLVGSSPFPMTLLPLMRLSGQSRNQDTKSFGLPFAHIVSGFADDRRRGLEAVAARPYRRMVGFVADSKPAASGWITSRLSSSPWIFRIITRRCLRFISYQ